MNSREGAIWAYRLLLNREPESEAVIAHFGAMTHDPVRLAWALINSFEHQTLLDRAGARFEASLPMDHREGAAWAYRLLLEREPSQDEIDANRHFGLVNDLRLNMLTSLEYERSHRRLDLLRDFAVVNAFAPFPDRSPVADSFVDFVGTATRVRYLDGSLQWRAGLVEDSVPRPSAPSLHGTAEWVGGLRSVLEARDSLTVIELGAGWAPWLVAMHHAARLRGIERFDLTGVEGSADHAAFMRDHFISNGLDPDAHRLLHAVVGAEDGEAHFPRLHVAADDYGANAVFDPSEGEAALTRGELETVRCIALNTLLADKTRVDLLHIDIQGHEVVVIESALDALNARVRRMVVGTHSRAIEGRMFEIMSANGWSCEAEIACRMRGIPGGTGVYLAVDGEQVWRNDRLAG